MLTAAHFELMTRKRATTVLNRLFNLLRECRERFVIYLKALRPATIAKAILGGIVIGVLGNAVYDCLKLAVETEPVALAQAPKLRTSPEPLYPELGFDITLNGFPVALAEFSSIIPPSVKVNWAVQEALGTNNKPSYEIRPHANVLRIVNVQTVESDGIHVPDKNGCWNPVFVIIRAELSGRNFQRDAFGGTSATVCQTGSLEEATLLALPTAVAKLVDDIRKHASRPLPVAASTSNEQVKRPGWAKCLPCWLWSRGCAVVGVN